MLTTVVDRHKLSAPSEPDFSIGRKTQFLPTLPTFAVSTGGEHTSISRGPLHHKTTLLPVLAIMWLSWHYVMFSRFRFWLFSFYL